MELNGARIQEENIKIEKDTQEKINEIIKSVKTLSPKSDLSMRFVKSGKVVECLLWGRVKEIPIGIYNRGPSLNAVLELLKRKVKKECLKIRNESVPQFRVNSKIYNHLPFEMAG
jgi:hypothetical protein